MAAASHDLPKPTDPESAPARMAHGQRDAARRDGCVRGHAV